MDKINPLIGTVNTMRAVLLLLLLTDLERRSAFLLCLQQRRQLSGAGEEIVSKSSKHNPGRPKASSEKIVAALPFRIGVLDEVAAVS